MTRSKLVIPRCRAIWPLCPPPVGQTRLALLGAMLGALCLASTDVNANVYKCPDPAGKMVYQDAPCGNSKGDEKPFIASPSARSSAGSITFAAPPKDASEAALRVVGVVASMEHMVSHCIERVPSVRTGLRAVRDKWLLRQRSVIEASQNHLRKKASEMEKGYFAGGMQSELNRASDQFNRARPEQRLAACNELSKSFEAQELDFINQPAVYESLRAQLPMN